MPTESQKRARDKWDKEHTTILGCKVRKEYAEQVKNKAKREGTSVSAILLKAIKSFMGDE